MRSFWLMLLVALAVGTLPAQADPAASDVSFTRQGVFMIPFQTDPGERRIREIQLFVSADQGKNWQPYANVKPEEGNFKFTSPRDGQYWFTVRTVDLEGRTNPPTLEGVRPGLKVIVDTTLPTVQLKSLPVREGTVGVEWDVKDENLDMTSFVLDHRYPGLPDWTPLRVDQVASGQHSWKPGTNGSVDVRLRVRDRAGNAAESKVSVTAGSQLTKDPNPPVAPPPPTGGPNVRLVNSKRINLNYEIKEEGPSGVSAVELWYTQDGRNWQKYGEDTSHKPPFTIDVNDEGVYGFTLLVRSGVGLSDRPPQVGDPPQVWVEVDLTKPSVRLNSVDVGRGSDSGNLTVCWAASDKNLGRHSITLSHGETKDGPWTPFAVNIENTGRYVWRMPSGVPYRFFIKVEATDKAGNVGADIVPKIVIVDLAQPKASIVDVAPSQK